MSRFASALSQHPVPEGAAGETAGSVLEQLGGEHPDLLVCFVSRHFVDSASDIAATLREILHPAVMIGATVVSVIGGGQEVEDDPALSLFAASLPGARLTPAILSTQDTPDGRQIFGWPDLDEPASALLLLVDPFSFPTESFLRQIDELPPSGTEGLQVIGGLASAALRPGGNRLLINDVVCRDGAVGVFLSGVEMATVVSQGCRPIGSPFVVTRAQRNVVEELAGRTPLQRLEEVALEATEDERELLRRGLHVGIVVDEHRSEFQRGDFLVRGVMGADQSSGSLAFGEVVDVGQTVQFHVRDAAAADEDLRLLLAGRAAAAALMFTCNGRGRHLFGTPDHDAGVLQELVGPLPAAGGFCAGEIGPVGDRNYVHGFTASLALFS